jgi:hypothetical protein
MDNIKSIKHKLPQIIELENLILLIGFKQAPNTFSISFNDEPDTIPYDTQYCYYFNKWRILIEYKNLDVCTNSVSFELAGLHIDNYYDVSKHLYFGNCTEQDINCFNVNLDLFRDKCKEILYHVFKNEIRKNKIKNLLG